MEWGESVGCGVMRAGKGEYNGDFYMVQRMRVGVLCEYMVLLEVVCSNVLCRLQHMHVRVGSQDLVPATMV